MGLGIIHLLIELKRMKKIFYTMLLSFSSVIMANAQIKTGFYHIKNAGTNRYISISDTKASNYEVNKQAGTANLNGIRTLINYDSVAVSPSCVILIKELGNGKYDLAAQGSSLYAMTSNKLPIDITASGGSYIISGTYSGITKRLTDRSPSNQDGYLVSTETGMDRWNLIPINTTDQYIGIRPDVRTADGAYWGTIFAGFNFRLVSEGMTAFYVSNAGGTGFTLTQIDGDVVPYGMPVVIKCNSSNPADNKIEPVIGSYELNVKNWLSGVYCALSGVPKHTNVTLYDPMHMRVLGVNEEGNLAFVNAKNRPELLYKDQYLKANKAYLNVSPTDADVMTHGDYTPWAINSIKNGNNTSTGIYTLTGVRLPDGVTPRSGIYVKDGKKIIIK